MNEVSSFRAIANNSIRPLPTDLSQPSKQADIDKALEVREAFGKFVSTTFYGQLLKSLRTSVGKAAYFHGGQGEEIFQSQLDQHIADKLAQSPQKSLVEPMFKQQFPRLAELLSEHEDDKSSLNDLSQMRRQR